MGQDHFLCRMMCWLLLTSLVIWAPCPIFSPQTHRSIASVLITTTDNLSSCSIPVEQSWSHHCSTGVANWLLPRSWVDDSQESMEWIETELANRLLERLDSFSLDSTEACVCLSWGLANCHFWWCGYQQTSVTNLLPYSVDSTGIKNQRSSWMISLSTFGSEIWVIFWRKTTIPFSRIWLMRLWPFKH